MTFERVKKIAEELGWKVESDTNSGNRCITFYKTSPAGEDFSFDIWTDEDKYISTEVLSYAINFDEEEHVKLMLNAPSAPSMKELVADAEKIKVMVNDLADAIETVDAKERFSVTPESPLCYTVDSFLAYATFADATSVEEANNRRFKTR